MQCAVIEAETREEVMEEMEERMRSMEKMYTRRLAQEVSRLMSSFPVRFSPPSRSRKMKRRWTQKSGSYSARTCLTGALILHWSLTTMAALKISLRKTRKILTFRVAMRSTT